MTNNRQLRKEIKRLTEENRELRKKYDELNDKFNEVLKELRKYKNSNTPSSSNKHLKPNTQGKQSKLGGKRGAPNGHSGTNRQQTPTTSEVVDCCRCPGCNSENIEDDKVINQTVEDVPQPVVPETKKSEIHVKKCNDCGLSFVPPNNQTPLKGKFGINLMVLVIFIKFILRGVLRKTSSFLDLGFMMKITPASLNAIIKRASEAANKEYEELKQRIHQAEKVYVDETSFSVLGKNQWVWVFRTSQDILLVIRPSRGCNVLKEILGENYAGTVICDCWRAYNFLGTLQRCWAHLLRKSKIFETVAGKNFHQKLKELFEEIKKFNESNPTQYQRDKQYENMTERLRKITAYYSKYDDLITVTKYINFNLENWFTCIKKAGIEPTNNFAEQAIRETVMVRKIIGAFRSESGKKSYEIMASLIASWQLKGLNLKEELRRMLVKNLCFV